MLSPTMTVFVLIVLWAIVVIPMIFRGRDEKQRERSVDGFGRAMRALARRPQAFAGVRHEVSVPRRQPAAPAHPTRRPVPASQEALMYPVDRSDLSAARAQMMARRRRSLTILTVGTVVLVPTAFVVGGLTWLLAVPFLAGLVGYLYFLRGQTSRDRARRENRQHRAVAARTHGVDATEQTMEFAEFGPTVVRIDDDDIELQNFDTIDLTGLYSEQLDEAETAARRAS